MASVRNKIKKSLEQSIKRSSYTAYEVYNIVCNTSMEDVKEILENKFLPIGLRMTLMFMIEKESNRTEVVKIYFDALNRLESVKSNREHNRLRNQLLSKQIEKLEEADEIKETHISFSI